MGTEKEEAYFLCFMHFYAQGWLHGHETYEEAQGPGSGSGKLNALLSPS